MTCVGLFKLIYYKPLENSFLLNLRFESNVFINGFKTYHIPLWGGRRFESNVFINGFKTEILSHGCTNMFESNVFINGFKTPYV